MHTFNRHPYEIKCDFKGGKGPYHVALPYPNIRVMQKNERYADILSRDIGGEVSELTAITQYINHEIRSTPTHCEAAQTFFGIAKVEMMHLEMIGQTITLLGGDLEYKAKTNEGNIPWSGDYVDYGTNLKSMIIADIEAEKKAIRQYQRQITKIADPYIQELLQRIVLDEHFHIGLLTKLLKESK